MVTRAASIMPRQAERRQSMPNTDSVWGRRASILPSLSWKKSSEIQIVLDGEQQFIHTYSTFDDISGHVNLKFEKDTMINLIICFQGQTSTWVEKVATTSPALGKTTGKHTFMRVQQPIDHRCLPENSKALAGVTYSVPFKFTVPDRILDFICNHKVNHPSIKDCHLQLPPSMGDPMLAGEGNTLMDDLAPKMGKVNYTIRVSVEKIATTSHKEDVLTEEVGVRIVPAREELPPLEIDPKLTGRGHKYSLRKEKIVRRGIMNIGKKAGCLAAEAFQPASLKLPHPTRNKDEAVTTTTTIRLRYDPTSAEEQPPALNNVANKLKVYTFIGAAPWNYTPAPDTIDIYSTLHTQYPETVNLSSRNLSNVEWTKHEPGMSRRASILSTSTSSTATSSGGSSNSSASTISSNTITAPSTSYDASLPYYTTSIVVPVTLPTASTSPSPFPTSRKQSTTSIASSTTDSSKPSRKPSTSSAKPITFIPTFHSCLLSRLYTLEFSLTSSSAPTINLRVPVQMSLPYTRSPVSSPLPAFPSEGPGYFNRDYTHIASRHPADDDDNNNGDISPTSHNPEPDASLVDMDTDTAADDEALAQALDSATLHHHFRNSGRRLHRLNDVPEHDHVDVDTYFGIDDAAANTTPTNTGRGARHASLPSSTLVPAANAGANELPPDYDSATRQMPRPSRRRPASQSANVPLLASMWSGSGNDGTRPLVVRYITE